MKKFLVLNLFIVGALLLVQNWGQAFGSDRYYSSDECCDRVYDCGDPLNCGSINFMARVGAAPTLWRDRGNFSAISCNGLAIVGFNQTTINFFQLPHYSKFFHVPWFIGGQIGYALTNNVEVYLELNYRAASSRGGSNQPSFVLYNQTPDPNDTVNIALTLKNHYRIFDAYVGARYYWGRYCCEQVAFFLGAKFGLVHHKPVCFQYLISPTDCPVQGPLNSTMNIPFFLRSTMPASGINFGFDWCIGCSWSVMLLVEAVATCGPATNQNFSANNGCTAGMSGGGMLPGSLPNNIIIGNIGTELFFPITLGLKYSF
jgi:hypothetical protein